MVSQDIIFVVECDGHTQGHIERGSCCGKIIGPLSTGGMGTGLESSLGMGIVWIFMSPVPVPVLLIGSGS